MKNKKYKIVIVSQCFWPDTASVAQHLSDLADELSKEGHEINVYTSLFSYENKSIKYPKKETHKGILINRLYHSYFGKKSIIGRALDFISFNISVLVPLLFINKKNVDMVIAMPPPPMLPFLASFISRMKNIPFIYWAMDLQPELSYATGILREGSIVGIVLNYLNRLTVKNSKKIIALDKDMKKYLISKGAKKSNTYSIPVWQVMEKVYKGDRLSNPFRIKNNFDNKIVIMYSGNYGNAHPVDCLLETAKLLRNENSFLFVFVGGGTQYDNVKYYKDKLKCRNIIQLPYEPRENIHISLASADFHAVVLNENTVGFTHPNKIYGAMFVGKPILFIGPIKSYAGEILKNVPGNLVFENSEAKKIVDALFESKNKLDYYKKVGEKNREYLNQFYNAKILKKRIVEAITH